MSVTRLDDHRPHLCIPTPDGNAHVLPVSLIDDIIAGRRSIDDIADRDQVMRAILSSWLDSLT